MCLPRDPRFVGSNQAEVNRFFQDIKIQSTNLSEGALSHGPKPKISGLLKNLKAEKIGF